MSQVVDADGEIDAAGLDGGEPDPGAEGVEGDRGAGGFKVQSSSVGGMQWRCQRLVLLAAEPGNAGAITWVGSGSAWA